MYIFSACISFVLPMYKPARSVRLIGSGSLAVNVVNSHAYIDVALLAMFWPLGVKESGSVHNSWPT